MSPKDFWLLWFASLAAMFVLGGVIVFYVVRDKYEAAVSGCRIIRRDNEAAANWLRIQRLTRASRKPSAEAHIEHMKAVVAVFFGALKAWLAMPSLADMTDGEARERAQRAPVVSRLTWRGTFAELLPANARHEVLP